MLSTIYYSWRSFVEHDWEAASSSQGIRRRILPARVSEKYSKNWPDFGTLQNNHQKRFDTNAPDVKIYGSLDGSIGKNNLYSRTHARPKTLRSWQ